ncbi:FAD-dependent oxidoreductase [Mycobacterium sp. DL99]|uniref:NAD(P)/FAD-dependent oxidoreductase n=1 Tax=Mycobacterium sp. DL99 TaxID=2528957 RepID=UPI0010803406|nr:FAD-dependent oxidoreductase [Mycobacterium sp. DL99]
MTGAQITTGAGESFDIRSRSLWLDQLGDIAPRPPLTGNTTADIVIIGGGFTGLWTALHLAKRRQDARIVVLERHVVGFGAAGRNGGWCGAGLAGSAKLYAKSAGWKRTLDGARLFETAIDEIGRVIDEEGIAADFVKGGTLVVATTEPQWARLQNSHAAAVRSGLAEPGARLLSADEVRAMVRTPSVSGGLFTPHCARFQPARLVRGLAEACVRRGVVIHEQSSVTSIESGLARTQLGAVRADTVLRATEAWTGQLPRSGAPYLPLTSMMIATEPLPSTVWDELGWPHGLTIRDRRHLFFYAQRTADDRIAIGGRGAPYRLRDPLAEFSERDRPVWRRLEETLRAHFPQVRGAAITHRWGGALAVPRDWSMSVAWNPDTRVGTAGGYGGHGIVAAYAAGRGLADLVTGHHTDYSAAAWVGHRSRRWEPEPLRYLAATAIVRILNGADRHEDRTGRTAERIRLLGPVLPPG